MKSKNLGIDSRQYKCCSEIENSIEAGISFDYAPGFNSLEFHFLAPITPQSSTIHQVTKRMHLNKETADELIKHLQSLDFRSEKQLQEDMHKDLKDANLAAAAKNKEVLSAVKLRISSMKAFKDVLYSIEMSENTSNYKITDAPRGKFQTEGEFEKLKGVWVNQTTDGGMSGDEFAGTVSIQISNNEYFQYNYSM